MHDIDFVHIHVDPEEKQQLSEVIWSADNVELTTIGIDIGSSTSHLMFGRVHMQRLSTALSSRFVVVGREIIWQSPIFLTPYLTDYTIDTQRLARFVARCYADSGIARETVDSGAVILTGEALKRRNARAIAELFSAEAGKFVCASAGHHLEAQMAAHGSGAIRLSKERQATLLNVDIGGGTTKFALVRAGETLATIAIAVGGRLVVETPGRGLVRVEEPAVTIAESLGFALPLGGALSSHDRRRLTGRMTDLLVGMIARQAPDGLAARLLVTDPWPTHLAALAIDGITFSGGVAEYLYGREKARFGDLGADLAHDLAHAIADGKVAGPVIDPGNGIRATVVGAAQFSVQISGNTILITRPDALPLRNLPALCCQFDLANISVGAVAGAVRAALDRSDLVDGEGPIALTFPWSGDPLHARLRAIADGISAALAKTIAAGLPLVVIVDGDVGMTLGRIIHHEAAPGANVIALDGVQLRAFDYVDIGGVISVTNVVPLIIKSLLF
jgi:ethanolamine utilization protein EutA